MIISAAAAPSPPARSSSSTAATSSDPDASVSSAWEAIISRRPNPALLPLDTALLHNPSLATTFYAYNNALHTLSQLPVRLLSLAICRVAVLCGSSYSWNTHSVIALRRGLDAGLLGLVQKFHPFGFAGLDPISLAAQATNVVGSAKLDGIDLAVLVFTDDVTKNCVAGEDVVEELKHFLTDREILELTVAIGEYNSVCRILLALQVGLENEENKRWNSVEESLQRV